MLALKRASGISVDNKRVLRIDAFSIKNMGSISTFKDIEKALSFWESKLERNDVI